MHRSANPLFLKAFSRCRRIGAYIVVLVTVGGCAALRNEPPLAVPDVGGFAVKGRLAVRQGDDGFTANFSWQHSASYDEIDLWGPWGQGHSRWVADATGVTVYTSKGEVYREHDADAAMQRWLGFTLPVDALMHWIRGEQVPGLAVAARTTDDGGNLMLLEQLSWRLEFSRYRVDAGGARLPGRIVALRDAIKVTLLPSEWSFAQRPALIDTL
jgi:outer membrane lipoprotein LolB